MEQSRVLLVEDDSATRNLYALFLTSEGFKVKVVRNGVEALIELQESVPDVILVDIGVPTIDGIQLISIIRNRTDLANITVIALTAYDNILLEHALSAGANKAVTKPTDLESLRDFMTRSMSDFLCKRNSSRSGSG